MRRLISTTLADPTQERVRQDHAAAITELQSQPFVRARVVSGVELADGVPTPVAHGLGRPAVFVRESCPRNASSTGRVTEVRTGTHDRSKYVVLQADGWGATITTDVLVA